MQDNTSVMTIRRVIPLNIMTIIRTTIDTTLTETTLITIIEITIVKNTNNSNLSDSMNKTMRETTIIIDEIHDFLFL